MSTKRDIEHSLCNALDFWMRSGALTSRPSASFGDPWSPWAEYLAVAQRGRSADRPYLELAAIGERLRHSTDRRGEWAAYAQQWAERFGPLELGETENPSTGRPQDAADRRAVAGPLSSESVQTFGTTAIQFADCIQLLADEAPESHGAGQRCLEKLLADVRPMLKWDAAERRWRRKWFAPTLLATFALMVFEDLVEGRQLKRCTECGRLFVASGHEPTYCSMRCRRRAQQRRFRAEGKVGGPKGPVGRAGAPALAGRSRSPSGR